MDTMAAYLRAQAARASGARARVFDWDRAATIIAERKAKEAAAGLREDWGSTCGSILRDGRPLIESEGQYLASLWATPTLEIEGEAIDCWRYADEVPGWTEQTLWPESAKEILNAVGDRDHDPTSTA